ncbi:uncharacterized protein EV154DRAFT_481623 [Mucor mucedo]|uniref:uncharacterized protein n=1 Tax=Mucor mucedo TaxID=29922 RepID=UPI00221ED373|nr:uncharacterized protein EV154DRAFT_481623 [Mucor mucedo]KAI7890972.1 hypothetical protein EV154DRAFT_481623 [Mucor mucedo]
MEKTTIYLADILKDIKKTYPKDNLQIVKNALRMAKLWDDDERPGRVVPAKRARRDEPSSEEDSEEEPLQNWDEEESHSELEEEEPLRNADEEESVSELEREIIKEEEKEKRGKELKEQKKKERLEDLRKTINLLSNESHLVRMPAPTFQLERNSKQEHMVSFLEKLDVYKQNGLLMGNWGNVIQYACYHQLFLLFEMAKMLYCHSKLNEAMIDKIKNENKNKIELTFTIVGRFDKEKIANWKNVGKNDSIRDFRGLDFH